MGVLRVAFKGDRRSYAILGGDFFEKAGFSVDEAIPGRMTRICARCSVQHELAVALRKCGRLIYDASPPTHLCYSCFFAGVSGTTREVQRVKFARLWLRAIGPPLPAVLRRVKARDKGKANHLRKARKWLKDRTAKRNRKSVKVQS